MINNWDIVSRIDSATGEIRYTLYIDGTEQDARLMAKKLKGYIRDTQPAQPPYIYAFELPDDIDEETQKKVHSAVEEGIRLTNKVDQFVPGGVLGDPLFNTEINQKTKGFPTFLKLDPTTRASGKNNQQTPQKQPELDLSLHTPKKNPDDIQARQVSMSENLEQTVAHEMTPPTMDLPTAVRKAFNIQETASVQNTTPPATQAPGVNPISINESDMLIKDMEGSMLEKMPLEDILSAETKYDMFVDVEKNPQQTKQTQAQKEKKISAEGPQPKDTFNIFEHELKEQTNVIDVEDVQAITDRLAQKNMDFIKQPNKPQEPQQTPSAPKPEADAFVAQQQTVTPPQVSAQEVEKVTPAVPFTLGATKESKKSLLSDVSTETLPEEEALSATVPPASVAGEDETLPEITVRTSKEKLDKTFNLETTFNTDLIKRQHEKNRARQEGRTLPEDLQEEHPRTKTILRLKKPAASNTAEESLGKTILRLRRKTDNNNGAAPSLKSTMSPQHAAENIRQAKQKAIDHSIQIPTAELKKHNWPLEVPLVPTYTLNNMVMSVNRFAHATAISVIESPGKLYNPLVLHGGTGTGKTHFLNALAYAFSQKFGQEHIFMTNGVRLSRGIQRYVMEGNIEKFENFMKSVNALLIDDIHLLAINEQNRMFVSKLLNTFIEQQKQIVITSKYPPESLEKLEELINFKLDSGWISELKPATGATHFRIVKKMLIENGVDLTDGQIEEFFGGSHMTLGTVTRSIRRLKVLENLIFPNMEPEQKSQAEIFEKLLATKGEDANSDLSRKNPQEITSFTTVGNGEWGRIGFFYPQNCSDMMNWMVYALQQRAKELNIEGGFDIVVRSSYATENIISSAFKIANLCDNKKLKGAVILGPKPDSCDPSVRENFYDILTHMLEIMLIRCGIINYENVRLPSTYVKVISELMR